MFHLFKLQVKTPVTMWMLGQEKIGNYVWMLYDWNLIQRQMWNKSKVFVPVPAHVALLSCFEASIPSTQWLCFALYTASHHSVPATLPAILWLRFKMIACFYCTCEVSCSYRNNNSLIMKNKTFSHCYSSCVSNYHYLWIVICHRMLDFKNCRLADTHVSKITIHPK